MPLFESIRTELIGKTKQRQMLQRLPEAWMLHFMVYGWRLNP